MLTRLSVIFSAAALLIGGCTTVPPRPELTPQERLRIDQGHGATLSSRFEKHASSADDVEVAVFLRRIAQKLCATAGDLNASPVGVIPIQDRDGLWRSFGFPGNRVYLSAGLLRTLEFESEAAAMIALELAHIQRRSLLAGIEARQAALSARGPAAPPEDAYGADDFWSASGLFAFPTEERLEAARGAVRLLYSAGYDPRGLSAVWRRLQVSPRASPFDEATLEKLIQATRLEIAQFSPLRNPIVRTDDFIKVQRRLRKL